MSPEDAIKQLEQILRHKYSDVQFFPAGICSRILHIPFREKSGLSYTLTLFVEVDMAPTTGVATGISVKHPPSHSWEASMDDIRGSSKCHEMLYDLISDLGYEALNRERQTLKVLNNRDLGRQLAKLCHAHGNSQVSESSDQFTIKQGNLQLKVQIVESKGSNSPHASVQVAVSGAENQQLINALKLMLQQAS